jgi:ankyrin repeat protein
MLQKAAFRKLEAVKFFLNRGHNPYHVNLEGDNAIIIAAERNQLDIIKYLYENYGLSLFAIDKESTTAMDMAKKNKHENVIRYLESVTTENWRNRVSLLAIRSALRFNVN